MSGKGNSNYFNNSDFNPLFNNQKQRNSSSNLIKLAQNLNFIQNNQATDAEKKDQKPSTNCREDQEKKEEESKKPEKKIIDQKIPKNEKKNFQGNNLVSQNIITGQNKNISNINLNQIEGINATPNFPEGNNGNGINISNGNQNINNFNEGGPLGNNNLTVNNNAFPNSQDLIGNLQNENIYIEDPFELHQTAYETLPNNIFENNNGGLINNLDFLNYDGESSNTNVEDSINGFNSENYSSNRNNR